MSKNENKTQEALASLGTSLCETVALLRGVEQDKVRVTLRQEARDGKEGLLVDVWIDGKADTEAEMVIAGLLGAADKAAATLQKAKVA